MLAGCCQSDGVGSLRSCQTMKEAYAVRRTVPPSAEIQASVDKLLARGMVDDRQKMLSELARLGARLIIQRAVEEEFDTWLGRARYERGPERQRGLRNGFRPRRLQTAEGELEIEIPQARAAVMPFVSELFPKWHCKRLLRTDPLKALIVGGFVRGLSMRDIESLCEEAGLGKTSRSTVARICAELHERFEAFKRRDLFEVKLVVLFLDAIYLPVRPSGPKEGVICAWGITENGERALVSVRLGMREAKEDWLELGRDLIARGLAAPRLVVADGAPGLISAVGEIWPRADRQHCAVHRLRNLIAKLPKSEHDRIRFNYWSALTDATSVKDGKLRLQVLISELEHRGYDAAAQDVDRSETLPGLANDPVATRWRCHRLDYVLDGSLGGKASQLGFGSRDGHHARAGLDKCQRGRAADSAPRSGHERHSCIWERCQWLGH